MTAAALSGSVIVRRAVPADAAPLAQFARAAFVDTFGSYNRPEDLAIYLAECFGDLVQRAELTDPDCTVFLAEYAGEMIGYAMLREGEAPESVGSANTIEIARLYAGQRWIGAGIGATLMQRCLDEAASRGREQVWLGVWERNARAIAFYRRWEFQDVGSHHFQLGADLQTDRIMARRAAGER